MKGGATGSWREVAVCPACGDATFDVVGRPAMGFRSNGGSALEHPPYEVRECRGCGLYYKSSVLDSAGLAAYYADLDFAPFDGEHEFPTDRVLLARLRTLSRGARVLDFGCSTGRILDHLGPAFERFGVEINWAAREVARRRGITIVEEGDIREDRIGRFDAIVLTDVLEHLERPTDLLALLGNRLAVGGRLFIVTGLADAIRPRAFAAEHWYFRICGHLQMISRRHVAWLAERLGFEVEALEVISHYRRDIVLSAKQTAQSVLYTAAQGTSGSLSAAFIGALPGLRRAARWNNLPSTDQRADHVVAVLGRV